MINDKKSLDYYMKQDRRAHLKDKRLSFSNKLNIYLGLTGKLLKFQRLLRYEEYYTNVKGEKHPMTMIFKWRKQQYGLKLGFEIPANVFGPGLKITHSGLRIVAKSARVGKNCLLHGGINIGTNGGNGESKTPIIGDNVYIAPGAKIFGDIRIADNIAIGANSVVNKSFLEPGITIAGIPAKKVSNKGSQGKTPNENIELEGASE